MAATREQEKGETAGEPRKQPTPAAQRRRRDEHGPHVQREGPGRAHESRLPERRGLVESTVGADEVARQQEGEKAGGREREIGRNRRVEPGDPRRAQDVLGGRYPLHRSERAAKQVGECHRQGGLRDARPPAPPATVERQDQEQQLLEGEHLGQASEQGEGDPERDGDQRLRPAALAPAVEGEQSPRQPSRRLQRVDHVVAGHEHPAEAEEQAAEGGRLPAQAPLAQEGGEARRRENMVECDRHRVAERKRKRPGESVDRVEDAGERIGGERLAEHLEGRP